MPYAHARPGETCTRCNDPAARVAGTQALCTLHFDTLITGITNTVRQRLLTPNDITPAGFTAWAALLAHGIAIGVIDDDEARHAWETAKDFAA